MLIPIPHDADLAVWPLQAVIRDELVHLATGLPSEADGGVGVSADEADESPAEADVAASVPIAWAEAVEERGHVASAVAG